MYNVEEEYPYDTYFDYLIVYNRLTNREVAKLCGCDVHTIWLYRRGKMFPRYDVCYKIAQAFSLSDREWRYLFCRYSPSRGYLWNGKNAD